MDASRPIDASVTDVLDGTTEGPTSGGDGSVEPSVRAAEVWIGQLWSTNSVLCIPEGFDLVVDPEGKLARVVLILDERADGTLAGHVQFGELDGRTLPEMPLDRGMGSSFWSCSSELPVQGVEYTMLDISRTDQRLRFSIAPNVYWTEWCRESKFECSGSRAECAIQPACVCDGRTCTADLRHRLVFQLGYVDDWLEGPFAWPGFEGSVADVRLRRVK